MATTYGFAFGFKLVDSYSFTSVKDGSYAIYGAKEDRQEIVGRSQGLEPVPAPDEEQEGFYDPAGGYPYHPESTLAELRAPFDKYQRRLGVILESFGGCTHALERRRPRYAGVLRSGTCAPPRRRRRLQALAQRLERA